MFLVLFSGLGCFGLTSSILFCFGVVRLGWGLLICVRFVFLRRLVVCVLMVGLVFVDFVCEVVCGLLCVLWCICML